MAMHIGVVMKIRRAAKAALQEFISESTPFISQAEMKESWFAFVREMTDEGEISRVAEGPHYRAALRNDPTYRSLVE